MAFLLGCTGALVPHASVQPVKLHQRSLRAVLLVAPAYRNSSMSVQPVLSAIRFAVSLDNCTDARVLFSSVQPVLVKSVLRCLWTTAPTLTLDFVGSTGACLSLAAGSVTSVKPVRVFFPRRFNRFSYTVLSL